MTAERTRNLLPGDRFTAEVTALALSNIPSGLIDAVAPHTKHFKQRHNQFGQGAVVRGADRNAPCPCGSGIKAKKCKCGTVNKVVIPSNLGAQAPCPCGSGYTVQACGCPATVPPGVTPRVIDKTNPADFLPPLSEPYCFDVDDYITAAEHCHGGPYPDEYLTVLKAYHRHGVMKPEDACAIIELDIQRKQLEQLERTHKLGAEGLVVLGLKEATDRCVDAGLRAVSDEVRAHLEREMQRPIRHDGFGVLLGD
jgi:hypothetical protein